MPVHAKEIIISTKSYGNCILLYSKIWMAGVKTDNKTENVLSRNQLLTLLLFCKSITLDHNRIINDKKNYL